MRKITMLFAVTALVFAGGISGAFADQEKEKKPAAEPTVRRPGRRGGFGGNRGQAAVRIGIVKEEGIQSTRNNGPEPGSDAPDFSLTPLKFYAFKTAKTDITQENADLLYEPVSLSDFKDDKPVALIFGSYT